MTTVEICSLPIEDLTKPDALLFLWTTMPMIPDAIQVIEAWGFKYKTVAFTWIKLTKAGEPAIGMGHWTRSNAELCLLGTRGRPKRFDAGIKSVVLTPRLSHSEKPQDVIERINRLCGPHRKKIELFARRKSPGWDVWGDEISSDILLK